MNWYSGLVTTDSNTIPPQALPAEAINEEVKAGTALRRLFGYLLHYHARLFLGFFIALLIPLTNLVLIGSLIPIFNVISSQESVELFTLKPNEIALLKKGSLDRKEHEVLSLWQRLQIKWIDFKRRANAKFAVYPPGKVILILWMLIFPIHIFKFFCLTAIVYFLGTIGLAVVRDIRMELYHKLQRLGMYFFHQEKTGTIMSRVINDGEVVGRLLSEQFNKVLVDVFYILSHLTLIIWISWKMTAIALVLVFALVIPISKFATRIRRAAMGKQERLANLIGHLQELVSGIRVIRAFAMERVEYRRFRATNYHLYRNTFLGHYYHQIAPIFTEAVTVVLIMAFFSWSAYEVTQGDISQGEFFIFLLTITFIVSPLQRFSVAVNLISAASASASRIFTILDRKVDVKEDRSPKPLTAFQDSISYVGVSFAYPHSRTKALEDISFQVKYGESVALVGRSGAGKSTLMDLLLRLYDVTAGQITIDGIDIRQLKLNDLRSSIGVVSQDVFLFNTSVLENITYGCKDLSPEQLEQAVRDANAHEFIERLPDGYETFIGERGVMLSGGQRQRIAIARTLLLDSPILILDEATSSLDNESEYLIQQALRRLCADRTVFTIAHRFSSISHSQRILVIDEGRIVEEGNHADLLGKKGTYYELYEKQSEGIVI